MCDITHRIKDPDVAGVTFSLSAIESPPKLSAKKSRPGSTRSERAERGHCPVPNLHIPLLPQMYLVTLVCILHYLHQLTVIPPPPTLSSVTFIQQAIQKLTTHLPLSTSSQLTLSWRTSLGFYFQHLEIYLPLTWKKSPGSSHLLLVFLTQTHLDILQILKLSSAQLLSH